MNILINILGNLSLVGEHKMDYLFHFLGRFRLMIRINSNTEKYFFWREAFLLLILLTTQVFITSIFFLRQNHFLFCSFSVIFFLYTSYMCLLSV